MVDKFKSSKSAASNFSKILKFSTEFERTKTRSNFAVLLRRKQKIPKKIKFAGLGNDFAGSG